MAIHNPNSKSQKDEIGLFELGEKKNKKKKLIKKKSSFNFVQDIKQSTEREMTYG